MVRDIVQITAGCAFTAVRMWRPCPSSTSSTRIDGDPRGGVFRPPICASQASRVVMVSVKSRAAGTEGRVLHANRPPAPRHNGQLSRQCGKISPSRRRRPFSGPVLCSSPSLPSLISGVLARRQPSCRCSPSQPWLVRTHAEKLPRFMRFKGSLERADPSATSPLMTFTSLAARRQQRSRRPHPGRS